MMATLCGKSTTVIWAMAAAFGSVAPTAWLTADLSAQKAEFEVASVRPNVAFGNQQLQVLPEQFTATNQTLRMFILVAYNINAVQLVGAPAWINTERFDILAKAPQPSTREQMMTMLRVLLERRFRLKTHIETRQSDGYELVRTAQKGRPIGLHPVTIDCLANRLQDGSTSAVFPSEARPRCETNIQQQALVSGPVVIVRKSAAVTMDAFANSLHGMLGRPTVNRTGLSGRFDIELRYVDDIPPAPGFAAGRTQPEGVSLVQAIRDQLGLELRGARVESSVLVVDSIERLQPD